ncbi:MAG TPA: LptF/LptG family permease [Candidatus Omnitrophota bacterium]|nr:LptF/LptG family permease [Candidatus Omnitrophota bacterium]
MLILEKDVLKSYVSSFLFCVTLLIVVGIIGDILSFIENIFKYGISLGSIFAFYFYLAPFAFVNMMPFACLLAAVYVFNSLSKHQEITAVITSGISLWKLMKPVIAVTFILCIATFIVNDRFVPPTLERANNIRRDELEAHKEEGRDRSGMRDLAIYSRGGQIMFAKYFYPEKSLLESVIIHKQDENNVINEKLSARQMKWVKKGREGGFWEGDDVIVFRIGPFGEFQGDPETFKKKKIDLPESPQDLRRTQSDPKLMSYLQLKEYISILKTGSEETIRRLKVDLNYKLSFPFMALVTVLIGVPFSIETGRANALIGMAKGITAGVAYLPFVAISLALGKGGYLSPELSSWLGIGLFGLAGAYLINKKS